MSISHSLPKGWKRTSLENVAQVQTGLAKGKQDIFDPVERPYLRVANVQDGYVDITDVKQIFVSSKYESRYRLQQGDVLLTEGGDADKLGRGCVWKGQIPYCLHQNHIFAVRVNKIILDPYFLSYQTGSDYGKTYFLNCSKQSTNLASINTTQVRQFPVLLPSLTEQRAIVKTVEVWDRAISLAERLIAAKLTLRKGLMQQLLTGKRRFPGFVKSTEMRDTRWGQYPIDWDYPSIGEIARSAGEINRADESLPVLSCTKHRGLVDSLEYFGKQVYSKDLSTYKVVQRGQFAYATNHIEEGSIGYQDLYERALISPMYSVFETSDVVDDRFLYLVFKTELYRHIFEANTSASVDRRGSLRWGDFSRIHVPIPSLDEQRAIVGVFEILDRELSLLRAQLTAFKTQKRGLMQQLLTGKVRVRAPASNPVDSASSLNSKPSHPTIEGPCA